jgi:Fic family protein
MPQQPPYTITLAAADYLAKIVEAVTRLELGTGFKRDMKLHRKNRLRTIHSSLAIEGNTLSLDEVTAVIEGKLVAGKQTEVKEVKNAYAVYDKVLSFDPYSVKDFLKAHRLMTDGLVRESGKFRSGDVGVFDGDVAVHIGARPRFVPELIGELFAWGKDTELHPVLKSAVLHYEIETIHPFADGNGRMGRLWQTLTLAKWNTLFEWLPMESVLYENRSRYYQAIEGARKVNDSGVFMEFTLSAILDTINAQEKHQVEHEDEHEVEHEAEREDVHAGRLEDAHEVELTDRHLEILRALKAGSLSRKEIFATIGLNGDTRSFNRNMVPLLIDGLIEMTVPDRPNSRLQRYRLTARGRAALDRPLPAIARIGVPR